MLSRADGAGHGFGYGLFLGGLFPRKLVMKAEIGDPIIDRAFKDGADLGEVVDNGAFIWPSAKSKGTFPAVPFIKGRKQSKHR